MSASPPPVHPSFGVAAGAVIDVREAVRSGAVRLDPESAEALVRVIDQARGQVDELRTLAADELATPLEFGNNWVGRIVSERIATATAGGEDSAAVVLTQFADILADLSETVREAADLTTSTDSDNAAAIAEAGGLS